MRRKPRGKTPVVGLGVLCYLTATFIAGIREPALRSPWGIAVASLLVVGCALVFIAIVYLRDG